MTTEYHRQLAEHIADAKKNIRSMKRVMPGLFPEYSTMLEARRRLEQARLDYKAAKEAWDKLGK